jgi:hypothetical protein
MFITIAHTHTCASSPPCSHICITTARDHIPDPRQHRSSSHTCIITAHAHTPASSLFLLTHPHYHRHAHTLTPLPYCHRPRSHTRTITILSPPTLTHLHHHRSHTHTPASSVHHHRSHTHTPAVSLPTRSHTRPQARVDDLISRMTLDEKVHTQLFATLKNTQYDKFHIYIETVS